MNTHKIIDHKSSVWMSASAGTGKTKALIDRLMHLLLNKVLPQRILCLTFTKSAASEMLVRIKHELAKLSVMSDSDLAVHLAKFFPQLNCDLVYARSLFTLINETENTLKLQTIHAFAQQILTKFPFEANINPNFKLIDEYKEIELIDKSRDRLWQQSAHDVELEQAINYLISCSHELILAELSKKIIVQREKFESLFSTKFEQILVNIEEFFFVDKREDQEIIHDLLNSSSLTYEDCNLIKLGNDSDKQLAVILENWLRTRDNEQLKICYQQILGVFFTKQHKPIQKIISADLKKMHSKLSDKLDNFQRELIKCDDILKTKKIVLQSKHMLYFAKCLLNNYYKLKQEHFYLDYLDLIILTNKLLANREFRDWVLYQLDTGIDHILIDEAQDTSPNQWQIINYLIEEFFNGDSAAKTTRTIFVVGDDKQSIYSFQGARPELFSYFAEVYEQKARDSLNLFSRSQLNISYRSTKPILQLVNKVLQHPVVKDNIQVNLDNIEHQLYRSKVLGSVEIWPIISTEKTEKITAWPITKHYKISNSAEQILVNIIVKQIKLWLINNTILSSQNRPIQPGDILILVRTRNHFIDVLIKELKKALIPVAGIDRYNLKEHLAISDLIALGKFILLPEDDLNLATLLKSPLFNLGEEQLFDLCYQRSCSIWKNLFIKAEFNVTYRDIFSYLNELLTNHKDLTPYLFYHLVLETKEGRKNFIKYFGEEVNEPFNEFLLLTSRFAEDNIPVLTNFISWFDNLNNELKRDNDGYKNMIKIMTVHAAKGLQAPIVILPDTLSIPTSNNDFFFPDKNLFIFPGKVTDYNAICQNLKQYNDDLIYQEYLRLLYVAITRAADHLIICAYSNYKTIDHRSWYQISYECLLPIAKQLPFTLLEKIENGNYLLLTNDQSVKMGEEYNNDQELIEG